MRKKKDLLLFVLVSGIAFLICCAAPHEKLPVPVIFDTDIAPDYDDVGALAMLHALADNGEAEILATMSSNAFPTTVPVLSVINTYFNRPGLPVGVVKTGTPSYDCPRKWADTIIARYPHSLASNEEAMDAVHLYRRILSSQPDTSVTIITVGYLTNLANLLDSGPDEYSRLGGTDLVQKKVKRLVAMAGAIDSSGRGGYEANILADISASQKVFAGWPTEIILSGHEIGARLFTGMKLIANKDILDSPVKDAYRVAIDWDGTTTGRYSWDQTAVLVGVRGTDPFFETGKLDARISVDGRMDVIAGDRITYLLANQRTAELPEIIEDLMMQEPEYK